MLDIRARHGREVRALREELPDQPVGVLVCAPLPWTVWVREVDLDLRLLGEEAVFRHLLAPIVRERPRHLVRKGPHLAGKRAPDTRGVGP